MNGLHPIKMPSAKEKVAAELRKAILSRQLQEGEAVTLESVANQLEVWSCRCVRRSRFLRVTD